MSEAIAPDIQEPHAEAFADWLFRTVIASARGDHLQTLKVGPSGRFWLGRLAPQLKVQLSPLGERGDRLEPCEVGMRVRLSALDGRTVRCRATMAAWRRIPNADVKDPDADKWTKTERVSVVVQLTTPTTISDPQSAGQTEIAAAFARAGVPGLTAEIRAEVEIGKAGPELVVTLVNTSPLEVDAADGNLYETELVVEPGPTLDFLLDDLPDSFRYSRHIAAYGVNGGVEALPNSGFRTTDYGVYDRPRPGYWDEETLGPPPDLTFQRMSLDPLPPLHELVAALDKWVAIYWSDDALRTRANTEGWDAGILDFALKEAEKAHAEARRAADGLQILEQDAVLLRAFRLANRAFHEAPAIRHTAWRSFQLGFLLANIRSLRRGHRAVESGVVDILWFATGGGKTETYLLFTLTAAFHDRLTGKIEGITSWGRFPLRMLSLQQTQRFVDVFAAAELIRREEHLGGRVFSVGFLVGEGENGTPNRIERDARPGRPDPKDPHMAVRHQVLIRCPFCVGPELGMRFDAERWTLDHVCKNSGCKWRDKVLPFRIVDDEIYRFLPTVVLGTLDKAANVAIQASMRGFYGAPYGICPLSHHGFTYLSLDNGG